MNVSFDFSTFLYYSVVAPPRKGYPFLCILLPFGEGGVYFQGTPGSETPSTVG